MFFISGLIHLVTDWGIGVPKSEAQGLNFFMTQPFAIMLEVAVQDLYRKYIRKSGQPKSWEYIVGYIWVAVYFTWTAPTWFYPQVRHTDPIRDSFLVVRVVPRIIERLSY